MREWDVRAFELGTWLLRELRTKDGSQPVDRFAYGLIGGAFRELDSRCPSRPERLWYPGAAMY